MTTSYAVVEGDDYVDERHLVIAFNDPVTSEPIDLTGAVVTFLVTPRLTNEPLIEKIVYDGIIIPDQEYDDIGKAWLELNGVDTMGMTPGPYRWLAHAIDDIGQVTVQGRFYVITDLEPPS